jgi:hypothetical protein
MIELANMLSFAGGVLVGAGIVFGLVAFVIVMLLYYAKD